MVRRVSNYTGIFSGYSWVSPAGSKPSGKPVFITYSFPSVMTLDDRQSWPEDIRKWRKFSAQDIRDAKAALKEWEKASGIKFLETKADHGDIQFSWKPSAHSAFAYYPDQYAAYSNQEVEYFYQYSGNVYLNTSWKAAFRNDPKFKKYILMHEIGHALGLKHSFDATEYNSSILSKKYNAVKYTVMAYTWGDTPPTTIGPFDKLAIKALYGSPSLKGKQVEKWSWDAKRETLTQIGKAGDDTLLGTSVTDIIKGKAGNDRLHGLYGDDQLSGGEGNDVLIGGPGRDTFIFDTAPHSTENIDRITDFEAANDKFQISKDIFKEIASVGVLSSHEFYTGKQATELSHRIIFDRNTGQIFYDPDGSGPAAQVAFAKILYGTNLQASNFIIV